MLVLGEHEVVRRSFTQIEALKDPAQLAERWQKLADGLEVHASAEETIFYPELLQGVDHAQDDTEHAGHDHNQIRDAVRGVDSHPVGAASGGGVPAGARGDRRPPRGGGTEMLPPFRDGIGADKRNELGLRWLEFHEQHDRANGLSGQTKTPRPTSPSTPAQGQPARPPRPGRKPGVDVLARGATGSPPCAAGAVPRRTVRPASGTPGPHGPVPVFPLPR